MRGTIWGPRQCKTHSTVRNPVRKTRFASIFPAFNHPLGCGARHNMEHYMDFIFLVRSKDPTDYTGPEQKIKAQRTPDNGTRIRTCFLRHAQCGPCRGASKKVLVCARRAVGASLLFFVSVRTCVFCGHCCVALLSKSDAPKVELPDQNSSWS